MKPSFWQVARRPKWVVGLLVALAIAVLFAMFGNWQLSRSIRVTPTDTSLDKTIALTELAKPSSSFLDTQADRHAETTVFVATSRCAVITDRHQLLDDGTTKPGYWMVLDTLDQDQGLPTHLFVASGFFETYDQASAACAKSALNGLAFDTAIKVTGRYEPSEAPQKQTLNEVAKFDTLSVEQLINFWPLKEPRTYAGFLISDRMLAPQLADGGEPIKIGIRKSQTELNLLNAFYAIEWVLFSGFAVFMWGRLVQDERKRIEAEATSASDLN
jgi:cytochrome oxidase assembly protein ShyY1